MYHEAKQTYTRREILAGLASASAALLAGACVPARIDLFAHPAVFDHDEALVRATLTAFVETVVPGVTLPVDATTKVFEDPFFPFQPYRSVLAADLCKLSLRRCGERRFDRLHPTDRTRVVAAGLRGDPVSRRLYEGAVFLVQLAAFGGVYAEDAAVPALRFEGAGSLIPLADQSYPDPRRFLATALTEVGNAA